MFGKIELQRLILYSQKHILSECYETQKTPTAGPTPLPTDAPTTAELETTTTEATTTTTTTTTEEPATTTEEPATTTTAATEPPVAQGAMAFRECPEGTQSVEGLPNCCIDEPNYLGDGACDPWGPYNTEECAYDLGDCCVETCNLDSPYGCLTVDGNEAGVGPFGFFCLDPRFSVIDESRCEVENREWIGDGGCDAEGGYNTEECEFSFSCSLIWCAFISLKHPTNAVPTLVLSLLLGGWDMGDCCEETCNEEFSFYPCGVNQPYSCSDPDASTTKSNPTGSSVYGDGEESSPFFFYDGFEANVFDPLRWNWIHGDAAWEIERDEPASEGRYYAEARTEHIIGAIGDSRLELVVESPSGGLLSYYVQALIQAPYEDVVVLVDDVPISTMVNAVSQWTRQELQIDRGHHVIQWVHRKNPSGASPEELDLIPPSDGITRIDDVKFLPY